MLFNSYLFIFVFFPLCLFSTFLIAQRKPQYLMLCVLCVSLIFYSFWKWQYVLLILLSILFNYFASKVIQDTKSKWILSASIIINLVPLIYYKYTNFLLETISSILGTYFREYSVLLPLGISFLTFVQIAFLCDVYRGEIDEKIEFLPYSAFVTFFPHLIAGPIIHFRQLVPQLKQMGAHVFNSQNFSIGLTLFFVGLGKKTIFADSMVFFVNPVFEAASNGVQLQFLEAWLGIFAFTLQIYFDFSGYSDMAIGLARFFGISFPLNFYSPYQSHNIIEFWRRWHITLSSFLRDYLYIPLGGNRQKRVRNLLVTMLLGGLWHGAQWTFVIWGGIHGLLLAISHGFNKLRNVKINQFSRSSQIITFIVVSMTWVFFRAQNLDTALTLLKGAFGLNGLSLPHSLERYISPFNIFNIIEFSGLTKNFNLWNYIDVSKVFGLLVVVLFMPNIYQILRNYIVIDEMKFMNPVPNNSFVAKLVWSPTPMWSIILATISLVGLLSIMGWNQQFIYFEF